jgi:hypothetical protein
MKALNVLIFLIIFTLVAHISYAVQSSSPDFIISTTISSGGDISNSSNYKNYVATGIIGGEINSSSYRNFLGFFYTWLLADGQHCTLSSQCQGANCCSNLCSSSSCPSPSSPSGGGGEAAAGGGGGFIPTPEEFTLSPESVKLKLSLGESDKKTLQIKNTGSGILTIPLIVEGVGPYVSLSDKSISLDADESAEIILNFIGRTVGGFIGQIIAIAGGIEKSVPIILEVVSDLVLFDVKLDIPAEYAEIESGQELNAQITLLNVGAPEKVDVLASYFIKDVRGNIVYEETETFAVEQQISYQKSFPVHDSTAAGNYVAIVEIRYVDSFAISSQLFRVTEKSEFIAADIISKNKSLVLFISFILVILIVGLTFKLISTGRKKKK